MILVFGAKKNLKNRYSDQTPYPTALAKVRTLQYQTCNTHSVCPPFSAKRPRQHG